eukprot:TRINITY_DN20567_c0_g1_i1.p1 TRINITY_DN20567_c0_g1~~TRINITY_DN20567_c0_g1_i1.p1  ORF type:complete len:355 (-),score=51.02 TRINITY_DN20567_c0_g1_i1:754-1818(-)
MSTSGFFAAGDADPNVLLAKDIVDGIAAYTVQVHSAVAELVTPLLPLREVISALLADCNASLQVLLAELLQLVQAAAAPWHPSMQMVVSLHAEIMRRISPIVPELLYAIGVCNHLVVIAAYRKTCRSMPSRRAGIHPFRDFAFSFVACGFPGGVIGDICLFRFPRVLCVPDALLRHFLVWLCINFCPGDLLFRLLTWPPLFACLDVCGYWDVLRGLLPRLHLCKALPDAANMPLHEPMVGAIMLSFGPLLQKWEKGALQDMAGAMPTICMSCVLTAYFCFAIRQGEIEELFFVHLGGLFLGVLVCLDVFCDWSPDFSWPFRCALRVFCCGRSPHCSRSCSDSMARAAMASKKTQ